MKKLLAIMLIVSLLFTTACSSDLSVCSSCGESIESDAAFCSHCGALQNQNAICSKCGKENDPQDKFCGNCGEELTAKTEQENNNGDTSVSDSENDPENNNSGNIWLKLTKDANSNYATQYYYNYDGVLVAERMYYTSNDKTDTIFEYSYDDHGNVVLKNTAYSSNGSTLYWSYTNHYDEQGRLISVTDKFSNTTEYKYDPEGQLLETVTRNKNGFVDERVLYEKGKIKQVYTVYEGKEVLLDDYFYNNGGQLEKSVTYMTLWRWEDGLVNEFFGKVDNSDEIPEGSNVRIEQAEDVTTYICDGNGNVVLKESKHYHGYTSQESYQYISLSSYREQGLHNVPPTASGNASGENNSANNGSSTGNDNPNKGMPCYYCEQTGRLECSVCDGTGRVFKAFDEHGNKITKTCTAKGCSNGRIKCYHCGGDGIYLN